MVRKIKVVPTGRPTPAVARMDRAVLCRDSRRRDNARTPGQQRGDNAEMLGQQTTGQLHWHYCGISGCINAKPPLNTELFSEMKSFIVGVSFTQVINRQK